MSSPFLISPASTDATGNARLELPVGKPTPAPARRGQCQLAAVGEALDPNAHAPLATQERSDQAGFHWERLDPGGRLGLDTWLGQRSWDIADADDEFFATRLRVALGLEPRDLGLVVRAIRRGLEQTDRELERPARRGAVGHLGDEVRIDVPEADAAQRGATRGDPATATIPIIAVTSHAMREDQKRAKEVGCDAYMSKPIDYFKLNEMVQRYRNKK